MMEKSDYFERAQSWAVNTQVSAARSRRTAWTVAGAAAGVAMLEAVALALLVPLKTVQPITLLVDRQTGYVQAVNPLQPRRVGADEALTQSLLAQYVSAREGFDRATVSADYRRVALWSAGPARSSYLTEMPAANPASPFQRYTPGTVVSVRVKSVSKLSDGTALVRFDTLRQDRNGFVDSGQPWVSVVRYRFVDAPMQLQDRLVNPLGFQVTNYRRDLEAPITSPSLGEAIVPASQPLANRYPAASSTIQASPAELSPIRHPMPPAKSSATKSEHILVPINQVPLGSPLVSNRHSAAPGPGLP
jgi:type IV secretion system protein VirB8